jgi:DNA-directed RNA polymerase subunit RPC12/RpoP
MDENWESLNIAKGIAGAVHMVLTPEMERVGVTPALLKTTKKITCPRCGLEFSLFQSRAIACKGCRQASFGCQLARCLRCDTEFPLQGPLTKDREKQKLLADYMNNIVGNYNKTVGKKGTR